MIARSRVVTFLAAALLSTACSEDDPAAPTLNAPANVTATASGARSVTVTFTAVTGASSYIVERAPASGTFAQVGTTTTASYTDATVLPTVSYQYRVASVTGTRQSPFSSAISITTPAEGPKVRTVSADITANTTFFADTVYTLAGFIHVASGATLTIQPGTKIIGDFETLGSSLFILRGARIMACGTAAAPIVFTSERPVGQRAPGDWGGLIIVGNATINRAATTTVEGTNTGVSNPAVIYGGGTVDSDNSGELCYVRVEFAGFATATDQELNSFTFAAVGSGTKLEYLQAMSGLDDSFEWFGGRPDSRYLVSYEAGDDHFDASEGYAGRSQFMIAYQSKVLVPRTGAGNVASDPAGIENDGCNGAGCANGQLSTPYTIPLWANFTLVGTGPGPLDLTPAGGYGVVLRRGTGGFYVNGLVTRWPRAALAIRDTSTTVRVGAGDFRIANVLTVENGLLLQPGQQPYDTLGNSVGSVVATAASLFSLLPTDPNNAAQFDWTPAPNAASRTGGMGTFTGSMLTKAGTFIVPTSYRGAADPTGAKWWAGWTIYADN